METDMTYSSESKRCMGTEAASESNVPTDLDKSVRYILNIFTAFSCYEWNCYLRCLISPQSPLTKTVVQPCKLQFQWSIMALEVKA